MKTVENRYDFVYLFDCQDGNPNGDPDSDNSPRVDPETFQGLVSDVCLKRKVRNYVLQSHIVGGRVEEGYDVFVLAGASLESRQRLPYDHFKLAEGKDSIEQARDWMCKNFYDVRAFGAVMSTKNFNCGQVRGPVQLTFARSIDRVFATEHAITRVAYTQEAKKEASSGTTEMGRKHTVAYGLYRAHGFINPVFAEQTGFSEDDLADLWSALRSLFDLDRSAARGLMAARGLYIFKHDSRLGSAPASQLFEAIKIKLKDGVVIPRSFSDYVVMVPDAAAFPGVSMINGLPAAATV